MATSTTSWVLFVAIIMTSLTIVIGGSYCSFPLPGADKLFSGMDITELDIEPLSHSSNFGYRYPVIELTCDGFRFTSSYDNITLQWPNEVHKVVRAPLEWTPGDAVIYKSAGQYRDHLTSKVDTGDKLGAFSFTAGQSYQDVLNTVHDSSYYIVESISYTESWELAAHGWNVYVPDKNGRGVYDEAAGYRHIKLNRYCKTDLEKIADSFENNPEPYRKFIKDFGTHVFVEGTFGGLVKIRERVKKTYVETKGESHIRKAAIRTQRDFLFPNETNSMPDYDEYQRNSLPKDIKSFGGASILVDQGLDAWLSTVARNPWLYKGKLKPISYFIDNPFTKQNMERAVEDHVIRRYLHVAQEFVLIKIRKNVHDVNLYNPLKLEILDLKKKRVLKVDDVTELENEIRYLMGN